MYTMPYINFEDLEDIDEEDFEDSLEQMYPSTYRRIYPWVHYHCCDMEVKYGREYEPRKEDLDEISKTIYNKVKDEFEDYEKDEDDNHRVEIGYPYGRRGIEDLVRILLIQELLRRRPRRRDRRRRRRRRPSYPPYYGY
ncbi:hypothetical protein GOM49_16755 [Clostridium bovifaecis]|uniref:Uncharacterized protein n=1 Tax=Clostridium bovifaecis TaxID=2184719 RepID=A0A6I6F5P1_9CLOT|nr:hypothetical protein GOM49_16755 [Clostridium bovifaecis]